MFRFFWYTGGSYVYYGLPAGVEGRGRRHLELGVLDGPDAGMSYSFSVARTQCQS